MAERRPDSTIARLSIIAAFFGLVAAVLTSAFLFLAEVSIKFLSEDLPKETGWLGESGLIILIILVISGLLIGLIYKRFGEHSGLGVAQKEYEAEGRLDYKHLPSVLSAAFISLVSGASVGPEGSLVDMTGGVGTYLADKLKLSAEDVKILTLAAISGCFGGFFGYPVVGAIVALEYMFIKKLDYYRLIVPALVAAAVGYGIYFLIMGTTMIGVFTFPDYEDPHMIDMIYAALLGLLGVFLGIGYMLFFRGTKKTMDKLKARPIERALIGALLIGIIGIMLPLTLYSGQTSLEELFTSFKDEGLLMLLVLVIAKIVTMSISFSSGFKGGPIFPLLFIGGVFGMALSIIFPFIPVGVCVLALMASFICVIWPIPLSVSLFIGLATNVALVPVVVIGAVVGFIGASFIRSKMEKKEVVGEPVD